MAELRAQRSPRWGGRSQLLLLEHAATRRQATQLLAEVAEQYGFGPVPTPAGHVVCAAGGTLQLATAATRAKDAGPTCDGPHVVVRTG